MRKPNVLCVGFAKCGTTTLYEIIKQHSDIYVSPFKEPAYYQNESFQERGFKWYLKRYYDKNIKQKIIMEINNSLTFVEFDKIHNIYNDFGEETKILCILRNPVEKAYSFFKYNYKVGLCYDISDYHKNSYELNFSSYVRRNARFKNRKLPTGLEVDMLLDGLYSERIKKYMSLFGRENVKVIFFEDLIKNPEQISTEIFDFIGVEKIKGIDYNVKANESNRGPYGKWSIKLYRMFHKYIFINVMLSYLPYINYKFSDKVWEFRKNVEKLLSRKSTDKSSMSPRVRRYLMGYYSEDVRELEKVTGRDLKEIWF